MPRTMEVVVDLALSGLCALWVYFDASKRDWSSDKFANRPWKWALGTTFLWLFVFPLYLMRRGKQPCVAHIS